MAEEELSTLEKRLLQDIQRTGFPLELRVSNRFVEAGYHVQHSLYYIDKDEQKGREIEIVALRNSQPEPRRKPPMWLRTVCVVECKKSDKPWVIFTSPKTVYDEPDHSHQATGLTDSIAWNDEVVSSVAAFHPYWLMPRRGRSFHEAFRSADDRRESATIFKAVTTVVKAALAQLSDRRSGDHGLVRLVQPIVVLEGVLREAHLDAQEQIRLETPSWIPVSFAYQSAAYPDSRLTVIVVTEAALPELLRRLDESLQAWHLLLSQQPKLVVHRAK